MAGQPLPLKVVAEARRNGRVAMGKRDVILRYPDSIFSRGESYYIDWARTWLEERVSKKPSLLHRYNGGNLTDELVVMGDAYAVELSYLPISKGKIQVTDNRLQLSIPEGFHLFDRVEMRRRLLSKFVAKRYLPAITARVQEINAQHFGKDITSVRLKYNRSNWGSCSTKKNINLSTRLLLTPPAAMDYVIIHELCHLIEMNHSPAFYREVAARMPDYRAQEKWLSKHYVDF